MASQSATTRTTALVDYYIPSRSKVPNPSGVLRPRGIRIDGSVWVMYSDMVPVACVRRMIAGGARVFVIDLGPVESAKFCEVAIHCLQEDVKKAEERQTKVLEAALAKLTEVEERDPPATHRQLQVARREYTKKRQDTLDRTQKLLKQLEEGAKAYGVKTVSMFDGIRNRVQQLGALTNARVTAIGQVADALAAAGDHMAEAASNDDMPAGVVLDRAEDAGIDVSTARAICANGSEEGSGQTALRDIGSLRSTPGTSGNGHAHRETTSRTPTEVTSGSGVLTTYRARPRNAVRDRVVVSNLTDAEARAEVLLTTDDRNAWVRDIAGRTRYPLSSSQRNWLHIVAAGLRTRREEGEREEATVERLGVPEVPESVPDPTPAEEPAKISDQENTPERSVGNTLPPEYLTSAFSWSGRTKTFTAEASFLNMNEWAPEIALRSARTGEV